MDCYNFNFAMAFTLGLAGIYTSTAVGFNPFWFHLDQLNWHSTVSVEHDASLCALFLSFAPTKFFFSHLSFLKYTARLDLKDGDNHSPSLKHIEQLVKFAGTADGLSHQDFAAYRVFLEQPYPHSEWPGWVGTRLRCGEIGLIIGALGRGDFEVLGVRHLSDGELQLLADWGFSVFRG
jgi:hypothetical protein